MPDGFLRRALLSAVVAWTVSQSAPAHAEALTPHACPGGEEAAGAYADDKVLPPLDGRASSPSALTSRANLGLDWPTVSPVLDEERLPCAVVAFPEQGVTVIVEVAETPATRALGLGGHAPLGDNEGMFFVFGSRGQHRFWMKGMTFALDMLWLDASPADDGSLIVVHIAEDVAPDPVGTPDGARPTYGPAVPASFVLEVNAGWAASRGITPGSVAIVSHDPSLRPGRGEAVGAYAQNEGLPPLSHP